MEMATRKAPRSVEARSANQRNRINYLHRHYNTPKVKITITPKFWDIMKAVGGGILFALIIWGASVATLLVFGG